jgi:DNA-binding LacI/PurR family transcriptional regulator
LTGTEAWRTVPVKKEVGMGRKVTLQQIADAVGVSRMTVSNAFSRPDQLSAELRSRILRTADELGYAGPDPAGRMLSTGRSRTVGVLFTDRLTHAFEDPSAMTFLSGIASVLEPADLALAVLSSPREGARTGSVASAVVDGMVVYSVDEDSPGLAEARRRGLPLTFVDQAPDPEVPSVVVDDRGGARAAAAHLRRLGHRHVALVHAAPTDRTRVLEPGEPALAHHVLRERLAGWAEGLGDGATTTSVGVVRHDREEGRQAARLLLAGEPRPTAVLCLSDEIALGVVSVALEQGLRVPDDLSVVGFDDASAASWSTPALTTVRQPTHAKGATAARLLLDSLADRPEGSEVAQVVLPTELVVRASTAPPPARHDDPRTHHHEHVRHTDVDHNHPDAPEEENP